MTRAIYLTLVSALMMSQMVQASSAETEKFKLLDRNEDGVLTRSETAKDPALWSRFKRYDLNNDNKLTLKEFSGYLNR